MSKLKPSFILIGPSKTGTTSAFFSLKEHTQIETPMKKELLFFAHHYQKGLEWYLNRFPHDDGSGKMTFESTPGYFASHLTPHRIKSCGFDDMKFVMWMRNPVERIVSHYAHFRSFALLKNDPNPPLYVARQLQRNSNWHGEGRPFQEVIEDTDGDYMRDGEYIVHLKMWQYYFDPSQFLILDFKDLKIDYDGEMKKVQEFVGLPVEELPKLKLNHRNQWTRWKDVESISQEQIEYLKEYFDPYNKALYRYMGKDFGWESDEIIV